MTSSAPTGTSDPAPTDPTSAPASTGATSAPPPTRQLIVATDFPLQGPADVVADANLAAQLVLDQAGGRAGAYAVTLRQDDDSTAAAGGWDPAVCASNAANHVATADEVAVIGTWNSDCSAIEIPLLDQDPSGPMLIVSPANTRTGLTKPYETREPDQYYPAGQRNFARVIAPDDAQGAGAASFASKNLHLSKCVVLDDGEAYGSHVAAEFVAAAADNGVAIVGQATWNPADGDYSTLFQGFVSKQPDCVFLAGLASNGGAQLIRDKVAVLGANDAAVRLIACDGFLGFPDIDALPEAEGMYLTTAGLPVSAIAATGAVPAKFLADFQAACGHAPVAGYAYEAAVAMQFVLASIAASDGTRADVTRTAFSGQTVPASTSLTGNEFGIDENGDTTDRPMSIESIQAGAETFVTAWTA
ncbi:MAG: branched-chain amino acid transport system substrate-binding protein [Acidimicrobiales bacterium]|nr:branched-chain amino acid transport system substrate-binding protein [Acidimicrobiales bacterium]